VRPCGRGDGLCEACEGGDHLACECWERQNPCGCVACHAGAAYVCRAGRRSIQFVMEPAPGAFGGE
jgi:hypothetical protein